MKMQAKDTRQGGKYIDMRAAICDDQPEALEELKKLLLQIPAVKKVYAYSDIGAFWAALPLNMLQLAVGEAGVLFIIGLPLMKLLPRSRAFMQIARA